jgi:hypothetical protein
MKGKNKTMPPKKCGATNTPSKIEITPRTSQTAGLPHHGLMSLA